MSFKADAAALRLGLILGLVRRDAVVAWADALILADRAAEVPAAFDLSLGAEKPVAELVTLLGQVPGDADRAAVGRRLAAQLREALAAGRLDVVGVARAMFRLNLEGYAPDEDFGAMAYRADDGADLALSGTHGTLDELRGEVAAFLDRYVDT